MRVSENHYTINGAGILVVLDRDTSRASPAEFRNPVAVGGISVAILGDVPPADRLTRAWLPRPPEVLWRGRVVLRLESLD